MLGKVERWINPALMVNKYWRVRFGEGAGWYSNYLFYWVFCWNKVDTRSWLYLALHLGEYGNGLI